MPGGTRIGDRQFHFGGGKTRKEMQADGGIEPRTLRSIDELAIDANDGAQGAGALDGRALDRKV